MAAIVRKMQQRNLVDIDQRSLAFKVRSKPVDPKGIRRWMRRKGVPDDELYAPSPAACE